MVPGIRRESRAPSVRRVWINMDPESPHRYLTAFQIRRRGPLQGEERERDGLGYGRGDEAGGGGRVWRMCAGGTTGVNQKWIEDLYG